MTPNPTPTEGVEDFDSARNTRETSAVRPSAHPEMVTRIAVRLWMQEVCASEPGDFHKQPQDIQRYWRDGARIAIEAMAQPADEMIEAYCSTLHRLGFIAWVNLSEIMPAVVHAALHGSAAPPAAPEEASPRQVVPPIREDL